MQLFVFPVQIFIHTSNCEVKSFQRPLFVWLLKHKIHTFVYMRDVDTKSNKKGMFNMIFEQKTRNGKKNVWNESNK